VAGTIDYLTFTRFYFPAGVVDFTNLYSRIMNIYKVRSVKS